MKLLFLIFAWLPLGLLSTGFLGFYQVDVVASFDSFGSMVLFGLQAVLSFLGPVIIYIVNSSVGLFLDVPKMNDFLCPSKDLFLVPIEEHRFYL